MLRRFAIRRLGAFVLIPVFILMFLGGTVLYTQAEPVQPALQSYWLVVHVTVVSTAAGVLLVPGVASVLYLIRGAYDRNSARFARLGPKLPTTVTLDRLAYRTTIFGFPLFTFGVICGAIWAESAWGRFWGWDPKETTAFVAWVVYAAYLHSRATAGWRGNRAAAINILGFAVMIFNLFFINLVTTGLHSYAGVG
jgi:cytochrome c-type biogenesis protein CcsB